MSHSTSLRGDTVPAALVGDDVVDVEGGDGGSAERGDAGEDTVFAGVEDVEDGGEGGREGGGCPAGWSTSARFARASEGDAPMAGDGGARFSTRSVMCSCLCCMMHSSVGGGSGGGGGGGCGRGGDGRAVARFHRPSAKRRRPRDVSCASSVACDCARARLRSWRFDGSCFFEPIASPMAGLSLASGLACTRFLCKSVHVTVPSTWMRNECMFNSFASAAVRRVARRVALLMIGRAPAAPGARFGEKPSDGAPMESARRSFFSRRPTRTSSCASSSRRTPNEHPLHLCQPAKELSLDPAQSYVVADGAGFTRRRRVQVPYVLATACMFISTRTE